MNLLIDIGNSSIKSALAKPGSHKLSSFRRADYEKKKLRESLQAFLCPAESIGVSMLDAAGRKGVEKFILNRTGTRPEFISHSSKLPFRLDYPNTIGADRLCSAAAAVKKTKRGTILVVDFGTATTYTVIHNGILTGGMISPGILTSFNALVGRTSLPSVSLRFPPGPVGRNTPDNIRAGVLFQSLFTLERYAGEIRSMFGRTEVICTGGMSHFFKNKTEVIDVFDPQLVLKGINTIISE